MKNSKRKNLRNSTPLIIFAVILIFSGVAAVVTRDHSWADMKNIIFSWAMLIMVIGFISLLHHHIFSGFTLIGIASFFLLPKIAILFPQIGLSPDFIDNYWGVLVTYVGVLLLLKTITRHKSGFSHTHNFGAYRGGSRKLVQFEKMRQQFAENKTQSTNWFVHSVVFGNNEYLFLESLFNGGEINVAFGESKLDLRKTDIADGVTNIYINVLCGSCVITIPQNWIVKTQDSQIFCGKLTDSRIFFDTTAGQSEIKTLNIVGSIMAGNLELKN